jgi:hypothetical protein
MARTTPLAVQGILLDHYGATLAGTNPSLSPFIESANAVVDRVAACAIARDKTLTTAELELIERWLAAHYYASAPDQAKESRTTGRASAKYQGKTGMYLESTKFGQMAVTLDHSGCLVAIASQTRKVAGGFWGGFRPSEQTDYEDRD